MAVMKQNADRSGPRPPLGQFVRAASSLPLPVRVLSLLAVGLTLGIFFPHSAVVRAIYLSGTYFPRTIVTLAALLVFQLLAAATAKLILYHKKHAGRLFARILVLYAIM
jgi:Na+/H+-dicarboxylate symporter